MVVMKYLPYALDCYPEMHRQLSETETKVVLCIADGCAADCPMAFTECPTPAGSLSMCGGPPRGVCATSSGACSCSYGYAGSDCGSCSSGFYRQGTRCLKYGDPDASQASMHSGPGFDSPLRSPRGWALRPRQPVPPCISHYIAQSSGQALPA